MATEESIDILNQETFFSKVVPFFEKIRSDLLAILGKDGEWNKLLSRLYLLCDVNGSLELLPDANEHIYRANPSHSGALLHENTYYSVYPKIRLLFIDEMLARSEPQHIGEYVFRLLRYSYQNVEEIKKATYMHYRYTSVNTTNSSLALDRFKINIISNYSGPLVRAGRRG